MNHMIDTYMGNEPWNAPLIEEIEETVKCDCGEDAEFILNTEDFHDEPMCFDCIQYLYGRNEYEFFKIKRL